MENSRKLYPESEIFILYRSKFYVIFYIIPRIILYSIIFFLWLWVCFYYQVHFSIYWLFLFLWFVPFWFQVIRKILKYICDFTVVTPWGITTYKQRGILHSVLKEIPARRIKAVEVFTPMLLGNIFGYGSVDIIGDMNDSHYFGVDGEAPWVIGLTYVDRPHFVKSKISATCFK